MKSTRFADLLRLLAENEVEVIVVGMLVGVLQGAPLTTGDVDAVPVLRATLDERNGKR